MTNLGNFDANKIEPRAGIGPVPSDKYTAVITQSEMRQTKKGNGHYLHLTLRITHGPYAGRLVWTRLNLDNPNRQAVTMAQGELSAICRAVGVLQPKDSSQLHDIPMCIGVRLTRRLDTGDFANEIDTYEKIDPATGAPQPYERRYPPRWASDGGN